MTESSTGKSLKVYPPFAPHIKETKNNLMGLIKNAAIIVQNPINSLKHPKLYSENVSVLLQAQFELARRELYGDPN